MPVPFQGWGKNLVGALVILFLKPLAAFAYHRARLRTKYGRECVDLIIVQVAKASSQSVNKLDQCGLFLQKHTQVLVKVSH